MHFKRREITIILQRAEKYGERERERERRDREERRKKTDISSLTHIQWNVVLRDQIESIVDCNYRMIVQSNPFLLYVSL